MALRTCLQCAEVLRSTFPLRGEHSYWTLETPSTWSLDECDMCRFLFHCLPAAYMGDENLSSKDCVLSVASITKFKKLAGINATAFPFLTPDEQSDYLILGGRALLTPVPFSAIVFVPFNQWMGMVPTLPKTNLETLAVWMKESKASDNILIHDDAFAEVKEKASSTGSKTADGLQLRVIDCITRKLVPAAPGEDYVTLSYRWGESNNSETASASTSMKTVDSEPAIPSKLPNTIEDSVTVCTSLGFRYLWVDRYCIPREDPQELSRQIQRMNEVCQNSVLTIVACEGQNPSYGLPGISRLRKECPSICIQEKSGYLQMIPFVYDVRASPWGDRAWTYQEALLSNRRLYFTDRQVYFESPGGVRSELAPTRLKQLPPDFDSWIHASNGWAKSPASIFDCVYQYSGRSMTFAGDTIKAMLGILALYRHQFSLYHLWGMPFSANTPVSMDALPSPSLVTFEESLQWDMFSVETSRREGFPSWSWAGWYGSKTWYDRMALPQHFRNEENVVAGKINSDMNVHIELTSGQVLSWEEYQQQYDVFNDDPDRLSQVIHLDAYTSPITNISRDEEAPFLYPTVKVEIETNIGGNLCFAGTDHASIFENGSCAYPINSFLAVHLSPPRYGYVSGIDYDNDTMLLVRDAGEHWERAALLRPHNSSRLDDSQILPVKVKKEDIKMERRTIRLG